MKTLDYKDLAMGIIEAISCLPPVHLNRKIYQMNLIQKDEVLKIIREQCDNITAFNDDLLKKYDKFLYVEDGSVDIGELTKALKDTKVITYRQGSAPPILEDLSSNSKKSY